MLALARRLRARPLPQVEAAAAHAWREGWFQGIAVGAVIGVALGVILAR